MLARINTFNRCVDETQCSAILSVASGMDQSQTLGSEVIDLSPSAPQFNIALNTDSQIILEDDLDFSLAGGFASASSPPEGLSSI